jgi:hypothetical protein
MVLWVVASFAIYMSNFRDLSSQDSVPAALIPVALFLDGTVMLDRFAEEERTRFSKTPYWLVETPSGTASRFPIMTGVLATPFYALPVIRHQLQGDLTTEQWRDNAVGTYQKLTAALLAALSVALFWSVCTALGFDLPLALCLTLLYAFGSEAFSISSQALWQHGPASLAMLGCIRSFVAMRKWPRAAALALSFCAGLLVAIRPNDLVLAAPIVAAAVLWQPRAWLHLILPGAMVLAPILAYNEAVFGGLLGGYGLQAGGFAAANLSRGLPGSLFSPGRGLFVYFPAALLALILVILRPPERRDGLSLALGIGALALTILNSAWWDWGGGHCFGPRFYAEVQGPILVLLGLTLASMRRVPRAVAICLAVILPYSVFVQVVGTYSPATISWNAIPDNQEKKRLWDFYDNPVFRGVRANLP